jgi:hypothetical protein
MFSRQEILELMVAEVSDHYTAIENRKLPVIVPEFDDEGTTDFAMLDRWQDLKTPYRLTV